MTAEAGAPTDAKRVAEQLRWRLTDDEVDGMIANVDRAVERGELFTQDERDRLEGARRVARTEGGFGVQFVEAVRGQAMRSMTASDRASAAATWTRTVTTFVESLGVGASVCAFPDRSRLVMLDRGLVWALAALFGPLASVWPHRGRQAVPGAVAHLRSAVRLDLAARRFLRDPIALLRYRHDPSRSSLESYLASQALVFALVHELAHDQLGHLDDTTSLHLGPVDVEMALGGAARELAADRRAAELLFGSEGAEDVLFVNLVAVRGLFTVLAGLEREVYARCGRSHPPAEKRWDEVAVAFSSTPKRAAIVGRVNRFWSQAGVDVAASTPLGSSPDALDVLLRAPFTDVEIMPVRTISSIAFADEHFASPLRFHRTILGDADDPVAMAARERLEERRPALERVFTRQAFSWAEVFDALQPGYRHVPAADTISVAIVTNADSGAR